MNDQEYYGIRHGFAWEYFTDPYTNCEGKLYKTIARVMVAYDFSIVF